MSEGNALSASLDSGMDPAVDITRGGRHALRVEHGGRLNVEQRMLGFIGFLWLSLMTQTVLWTWIVLEPEGFAAIKWLHLLIPQVAALLVVFGVVFAKLPLLRWPRRGSLIRVPSPVPLTLLGFPALLLAPLLSFRDQRGRKIPSLQPEDVELAFRQLLVVPRTAGLSFLTWIGLGFIVDAIVLSQSLEWTRETVLALAGLWLALLAPYAVIVVSRSRAMLRPEYLSAPRPKNVSVASVTDFRVRLTVPAVVGGLACVAAPLLAGWIASHAASVHEGIEQARLTAEELARVAQMDDPQPAGRFLASHEGVSLIRDGIVYGSTVDELPTGTISGYVDYNGDDRPDFYVHHEAVLSSVVPINPPRRMDKPLLLLAFVTLALGCSGAIMLITRDVARDVHRAIAQVRAVASGDVPEPLTEGSFSTRELRQLVQSVDRLVTRITETNVAKYVAIERAQEADRLKSQFLANMSHDLRSPLNSIIGFSELLTTGIEGEITTEQNEMVTIIHNSGKELLQQIDDILDTAKIEAGRMEIHPEPTPPANLVSRATQLAKRRQDKAIEYPTETAAGLPPAFVDPYRTVQAVENVLVFAAELMDSGTISIRVRPGSSNSSRMIFISVETPIAPATAEQLTEVLRGFYRIPGHRGLGLGLPIAGSILELQAGSLGIEEIGAGMVFTLKLPAPEARVKVRLREK